MLSTKRKGGSKLGEELRAGPAQMRQRHTEWSCLLAPRLTAAVMRTEVAVIDSTLKSRAMLWSRRAKRTRVMGGVRRPEKKT